ncbi:hypothetical protein E2C01_052558 [Portunus trituberculatus]|uniref:Uncharacterized protein n=1 Tax=Portunus trituberculatus TaxID=210409 RepID=A0A5B7GI02_PORTR|nr:hypothetical protein [Portunus trituberculatus]
MELYIALLVIALLLPCPMPQIFLSTSYIFLEFIANHLPSLESLYFCFICLLTETSFSLWKHSEYHRNVLPWINLCAWYTDRLPPWLYNE